MKVHNKHKLIGKTALGAGLFLGITATGVSAKANVNQPTNVNNNVQTNRTNQNASNSPLTKVASDGNSNALNNQPDPQNNSNPVNSAQDNTTQQPATIHYGATTLYNRIMTSLMAWNRNAPEQPAQSAYHASSINHAAPTTPGIHQRRYTLKSVSYHNVRHAHNWFRDGLSRRNLHARSWIAWHESGHRWRILSYGGVCVGYFQLNPHYLGYRHGHVDLRPKHQVKVADRYVRNRYGSWVNAKNFWENHHWY